MERPCGIVINVKELFGSESKSQVYAHIHNLLERPGFSKTSKGRCFFIIVLDIHVLANNKCLWIYYKGQINWSQTFPRGFIFIGVNLVWNCCSFVS